MPHKLYKFKLLLDENLPPRTSFPRLNSRYIVKHVIHDFHIKLPTKTILDSEIMSFGIETKSIVITINKKDFLHFILTKNSGVIGISPNMSNEQIDTRLCAFLTKSTKNQIYGHINFITQNTIVPLA